MSTVALATVEQVTLLFNGKQEVKVNKRSVNGCHFLNCLLNGPFKESSLVKVDIFVSYFRFEVFEAVIAYANQRILDTSIPETRFYEEMIQLAYLWLFDELVNLLESLLIDRVSLDTLMNLHTLANMFQLHRLRDKCFDFESLLDEEPIISGPWGRCPKNGHENHSYEVCSLKGYDRSDDEWDLFHKTRELDEEKDTSNGKWEGEWFVEM